MIPDASGVIKFIASIWNVNFVSGVNQKLEWSENGRR